MQKNETQNDATLWAAKRAFLAHGYDTVSMDTIAEEAGITKRTLYNRFGSKEKLFEEVVRFAVRLAAANLQTPSTFAEEPTEAVTQFCLRYVYWSSWTDAVAMQRLLIALAPRFPQYAALLYNAAIDRAEAVLAEYVAAHFPAQLVTPWGSAHQFARSLLSAVSAERRFPALFDPSRAYPPPRSQTPFADLPEEPTIRHIVRLYLETLPC